MAHFLLTREAENAADRLAYQAFLIRANGADRYPTGHRGNRALGAAVPK
jgi:hypothetical protein